MKGNQSKDSSLVKDTVELKFSPVLASFLEMQMSKELAYNTIPEGTIDPSSIQIHLRNDKINSCLERVITEEAMAKQFKQAAVGDDSETAQTMVPTDKLLLDLTKNEFTSNTQLLD